MKTGFKDPETSWLPQFYPNESIGTKELVVLAPGGGVYPCDNRWRPNHVSNNGHKTKHVFEMNEKNSVEITTSENS